MRDEKEIREALKRLEDEHERRKRYPVGHSTYGMLSLVVTMDTLRWVLGDKERLPDFK